MLTPVEEPFAKGNVGGGSFYDAHYERVQLVIDDGLWRRKTAERIR